MDWRDSSFNILIINFICSIVLIVLYLFKRRRKIQGFRSILFEADAVCRHILLLKCRNNGLAGALTEDQRKDIIKVEPLLITRVHSVYSKLCLSVKHSETASLFLAIVSPDPKQEEHKYPMALHEQFIHAARKELGMPTIELDTERGFPVNLGCNH